MLTQNMRRSVIRLIAQGCIQRQCMRVEAKRKKEKLLNNKLFYHVKKKNYSQIFLL